MGSQSKALVRTRFGARFAPSSVYRPAGMAWGFTRTLGSSKSLPQAVENRKITAVAIGERWAAFWDRQAKGEKGKVLGCRTLICLEQRQHVL